MNIIEIVFVESWPWWLGGIVIGLLVPGMYYFLNHVGSGAVIGAGSNRHIPNRKKPAHPPQTKEPGTVWTDIVEIFWRSLFVYLVT